MRRTLWLIVAIACLLPALAGSAEARAQQCPKNATDDIYVSPTVRYPDGVRATGVPSPRYCAFKSITNGIGSARKRELNTGRIIVRGGKEASPATLSRERFPIVVPDGFTLTTADDPDLGGAGLDPSNYIVKFKRTASHALSLTSGEVRGITLRNARTEDVEDAEMVRCYSGTSALDTVELDGVGPDKGAVDTGLRLLDGCENETTDSIIQRFAGDGVVVEHGASLTSKGTDVIGNADEGVWIAGTVHFLEGELSYNGAHGVFIEQSEDARFDALLVHDNQHGGFYVQPSIVQFRLNRIFHNAMPDTTSTGTQTDPQMVFSGQGPYTSPETVEVNLGSGPTTMPRSHAFLVDSDGDRDVTIGGTSCQAGVSNRINGYSTNDAGPNAVGMRAINGAAVFANDQEWTSSPKVSVGAGSFIETTTTCGGFGNPVIDVAFPGPNPYY